jgi:hypothetical protein
MTPDDHGELVGGVGKLLTEIPLRPTDQEQHMNQTKKQFRLAMVSIRIPTNDGVISASTAARRKAITQILDEARANDATHVLFPGWTLSSRLPKTADPLEKDIQWLAKEASDLCVVAELQAIRLKGETHEKGGKPTKSGGAAPAQYRRFVFIDHGKPLCDQIQQHVVRSNDAISCYEKVWDQILSDQRIVSLGGLSFLVFVCGENNLLANKQNQGNRVTARHKSSTWTLDAIQSLPHNIVINPAHTEFGNQGKMHKRWKWLSQRGKRSQNRHCVTTTNIVGSSPGGRAMYAFRNGEKQHLSGWQKAKRGPWVIDFVDVD